MASNISRPELIFNIARPADVLVYTAGDQIGSTVVAGTVAPVTFPLTRKGGAAVIRSAFMSKSNTSITLADFRLYLFRAALTAQFGDNVATVPTLADITNMVGYIDFSNTAGLVQFANGVHYIGKFPVAQPHLLIPQPLDGVIYGLLTAQAAYVPVSGETFQIRLGTEQDG